MRGERRKGQTDKQTQVDKQTEKKIDEETEKKTEGQTKRMKRKKIGRHRNRQTDKLMLSYCFYQISIATPPKIRYRLIKKTWPNIIVIKTSAVKKPAEISMNDNLKKKKKKKRKQTKNYFTP